MENNEGEILMKNSIIIFFLLTLIFFSCNINSDDDIPPPILPPTIYGQLPTRSDIIQAAESVGATNVQVISYQIANGATEKSVGGFTTSGGIKPSWWREDQKWCSSSFIPTLIGVKVVYDETDKMYPSMSVRGAIYQIFKNAGFEDAAYGASGIMEVETITDNRWRLIPLPTHADIINAVEQLGANNIKINLYTAATVDFWSPPPITLSWYTLTRMHIVPADSSYNAVKGDVAHTTPRILRLSYEHPGLGSIITNNDVQNTIRQLFIQFGFESVDVETTGTLVSSDFPLPSYSQIKQAAENAGADNVVVSLYKANNVDVIPMNEGRRLTDMPIVVEVNYDGVVKAEVNTNIKALFANFTNAYIGNSAAPTIPLPTGSNIRNAALGVLYFSASLTYEPNVYTANGAAISIISNPGNAVWNAAIRIVMNGDGTNSAATAANAVENIKKLFNLRGFFNLNITVTYP